jgi:hypothetical protein
VAFWQVIIHIKIKDGDAKLKVPPGATVSIDKDGKATVELPAVAADPRTLQSFPATAKPISQDGVKAEEGGWRIDAAAPRTARLFEVSKPAVQNGMLTYRAQLKAADIQGKAYLEMWCRFPGKGEFFSKGLLNPVQETTGWASYETPFRLEKGEEPDLLKLNVTIEGKGTVWIKDIEVLFTPFERETAVGQGRGVDAAWIAAVQKLPAEQQVKAVVTKLKERNPGQTH